MPAGVVIVSSAGTDSDPISLKLLVLSSPILPAPLSVKKIVLLAPTDSAVMPAGKLLRVGMLKLANDVDGELELELELV